MEPNAYGNNSQFMSALERQGVVDMTRDFVRNTIYDKLQGNKNIQEEERMKIYQDNFDNSLFNILKLEYTIIDDFLIRTNLTYTHSMFNNEIKKILKPLIPFDDTELMSLLGLNLKEITSLRYKWNNSNDSSSKIQSTYLYHILNSHTKLTKTDTQVQTNDEPILDEVLYSPDIRKGAPTLSDIQAKMKHIEDKYSKKLKERNDSLLIDQRFKKYKDELDKRYQDDFKNEVERFKTVELSQMRIDENKKYISKLEKMREDYKEEYTKKFDDLKKIQKELEEKELKLQKDYEERYTQLKKSFEEKEKNLEYKENYLEKKYKNDLDVSIQKVKFTEELNYLKDSIINSEKKTKEYNPRKIDNFKNINPLMNKEIDYIKKEIEDIKSTLMNKPKYLNNNFIKPEEDKSNFNLSPNNKKISKETVLNSLNLLVKNSNNTNLNSNSPNDSKMNLSNGKKDRRKILEELEIEQYNLNNQMRKEFNDIMNGNEHLMIVDRDEYNRINNDYDNLLDKLKTTTKNKTDISNDTNKKTEKNEKDSYSEKRSNDKNNIFIKNENELKKSIKIEIDSNNGPINNNIINNTNKEKKSPNDSITNKNININNINKTSKGGHKQNNDNTGGYNLGGFGFGGININNNNNNIYNFPIKSNNSTSVIEENIEGEYINPKKDNSIKNINYKGSNKYQNETKNPIKEELEGESGASNNNSKEENNKDIEKTKQININKSNKFNNYDYGDLIDMKNDDEIGEDINYGASVDKDDLSGKKKMEIGISNSISGIAKKQNEISESAGGFGGLFQLQSHAGGLGMNEKESLKDFEISKGKNNNKNMNEKGTGMKYNQQNQFSKKGESADIPEEISSNNSNF